MWRCDKIKSFVVLVFAFSNVNADFNTDYFNVNNDGTYSFRHSNDDIGSFYHVSSKSGDQIVRGRYGSRNPKNGRVEETVYTSGPRGFRARGPQIHRKMDLSQFPKGPIGSPDDPLADPYDDPSYSFNFKTADNERTEKADSTGRVNGLYSYLDDIGERHTVRYAAGAGTGFEVTNAVPDSPASVAYNAPLFKSTPRARGKMSVRRGKNGQYDFIAAAPDHRRSETSGPDGIVRGSYSYLDDKGVQRTVQYIAGAGIGYRIVQNSVGYGTHLNPRPPLPEYGIRDYQNNDLDEDSPLTAGKPSYTSTSPDVKFNEPKPGGSGGSRRPPTNSNRNNFPSSSESGSKKGSNVEDEGYNYDNENVRSKTDSTVDDFNQQNTLRNKNQGGTGYQYDNPNQPGQNSFSSDASYQSDRGNTNNPSQSKPFNKKVSLGVDNTNIFDDDGYPLITPDRGLLDINRNRDWSLRSRDSTVIKNVGKWYINLPPGQAVRAHVQNIDILPLGGRIPSPSEALRQDESEEQFTKGL